jgi:hypothetical protein
MGENPATGKKFRTHPGKRLTEINIPISALLARLRWP